jgi:hypothetical protein
VPSLRTEFGDAVSAPLELWDYITKHRVIRPSPRVPFGTQGPITVRWPTVFTTGKQCMFISAFKLVGTNKYK